MGEQPLHLGAGPDRPEHRRLPLLPREPLAATASSGSAGVVRARRHWDRKRRRGRLRNCAGYLEMRCGLVAQRRARRQGRVAGLQRAAASPPSPRCHVRRAAAGSATLQTLSWWFYSEGQPAENGHQVVPCLGHRRQPAGIGERRTAGLSSCSSSSPCPARRSEAPAAGRLET